MFGFYDKKVYWLGNFIFTSRGEGKFMGRLFEVFLMLLDVKVLFNIEF